MPVMPWSRECAAFLELSVGPDKKAILDAMTRKNLEESTVSVKAMKRILHTEKNLSDERLDGLREVMLSMPDKPDDDRLTKDCAGPGCGIVKGMDIYDTYFPERLFEILAMRRKTAVPPYDSLTGRTQGDTVPIERPPVVPGDVPRNQGG